MGRILILIYGVIAYVVFLAAFLYAIGFVGGMVVPKTIDSGVPGAPLTAVVINLLLLGAFGLQHSIMARPGFKRAWTKVIPPAAERSTFVLVASLLLMLLYWQWRPLPDPVWHVGNEIVAMILQVLFWFGWAVVLFATFLINHFDLFGLRQIWLNLQSKPYTHLPFRVTSFYRVIRHPLMFGFIVAFWAAPTMSQGRLLFAIVTTAYILVAIRLEERDLIAYHGEKYVAYRRSVPALVPLPKLAVKQGPTDVAADTPE